MQIGYGKEGLFLLPDVGDVMIFGRIMSGIKFVPAPGRDGGMVPAVNFNLGIAAHDCPEADAFGFAVVMLRTAFNLMNSGHDEKAVFPDVESVATPYSVDPSVTDDEGTLPFGRGTFVVLVQPGFGAMTDRLRYPGGGCLYHVFDEAASNSPPLANLAAAMRALRREVVENDVPQLTRRELLFRRVAKTFVAGSPERADAIIKEVMSPHCYDF